MKTAEIKPAETFLADKKVYMKQYGGVPDYLANMVPYRDALDAMKKYAAQFKNKEEYRSQQGEENVRELPDMYAGQLNLERMEECMMLSEDWKFSELSVDSIFCRGAEWYKKQVVKSLPPHPNNLNYLK